MKFTTFLHRNVSMHFAFHNHGLALHLAAHIRILPNCQNTIDRGNLALEISIKDELIFKLERAFNFDVLREVILIGWYICHIERLVVLTVSPPAEWGINFFSTSTTIKGAKGSVNDFSSWGDWAVRCLRIGLKSVFAPFWRDVTSIDEPAFNRQAKVLLLLKRF